MTSCLAVRSVIACSAVASAPLGARSGAHANPVGRTISLRAPRAMAVLTGVLLATAPSQRSLLSISTGAKAAGMALLARTACVAGPRDKHHSLARENVCCDDVHRNDRVLQVAIRQMMVENTSEPVGWHEMTVPANEAKEPSPGPWEDVGAFEPAPEALQFGNSLQSRISGKVGAVDRADAGSNDHVGFNSAFQERAQHAYLDRPQAAAARQDKGCLRVSCLHDWAHGVTPTLPEWIDAMCPPSVPAAVPLSWS
jgi:hypothetical protein